MNYLIGIILLGALAWFVSFLLYKTKIVSKEAYQGKETKGIRIAKYVILIIVLLALAFLAYMVLANN